jgi:hypothetical protein
VCKFYLYPNNCAQAATVWPTRFYFQQSKDFSVIPAHRTSFFTAARDY